MADIPKRLYKYLAAERVDVLAKKRIRFTQPCFFNDPFEFRPGMPVAGKEGDIGWFEAQTAQHRNAGYAEKSRLYRILSLTEKKDSIPMWTHYADSHRGFVLGFDTKSDFIKRAVGAEELRSVEYRRQRISLTRGLEEAPWTHPDAILQTKSKEWEYEQEWRWVEPAPAENAELVTASNGELLFLRPLPPDSVCEIILGRRADRCLIESILALKSGPDYAHVELCQVRTNDSYYKLDISPLSSSV
jgi:hypothetical protein